MYVQMGEGSDGSISGDFGTTVTQPEMYIQPGELGQPGPTPSAACPAGPQAYQPPFTSAERNITEKDAPRVFQLLCGPSPWQPYLRANLNAHLKDLPRQRPIRIELNPAGRYKAVFGSRMPADAKGFVDRKNAIIYLAEFPTPNPGKSLVGLALHEAVHLFSHPPGRSNQLRASAYGFFGPGLLEGLTQVITEDIQAAQGLQPMRSRWQAYKEYTPVARRFIQIFTPALVAEAYLNGNLLKLQQAIQRRWGMSEFQRVAGLTSQKKTAEALKLIDSLERTYLNRFRVRSFRQIFR